MKARITFGIFLLLLQLSGCIRNKNPISPHIDLCETGIWYDWDCYDMESLNDWGMGHIEYKYYHNDREYNWYI